MFRTRSSLFLILLSASIAVPAVAQSGLLRATVVDADDEPLPGVKVTITSEELTSFHKVVTTKKDGGFNLRFQPNHVEYTFELLFEKPGYQSFVVPFSPSLTRRMVEEWVMSRAETEVVESHGDLGAVVTGSTNEAIEAFNAGVTAQREGDLAAAGAHFERSLEVDPSLFPACLALSQLRFDEGGYEEALAHADQALELGAGRADALRLKHQALLALGRNDEAEAIGAELEDAQGAVAAALRLYNEGGEAFQADDKATALAKFKQAADLDPTLTDAHHAIATLEYANGNYDASAAAAEMALEQGSEDVRTLRVLYDAYQALGRSQDLAEIAPRLAQVDPDFGGPKLIEQAADLWNAGQTEQAAELALLALSIDPGLAKAHYFIGLDHLAREENAEARVSLSKFIELAPDDPDAEAARGMLEYIQ